MDNQILSRLASALERPDMPGIVIDAGVSPKYIANCRRIVACANWCADLAMTTDEMEITSAREEIRERAMEIRDMMRQRDALRAEIDRMYALA